MKHIIVLYRGLADACLSANSFAQGVQTGTIRGMVKDQQELAVPGVTVTVTSPALQGPRSVVTDAQGGYVFRDLPPGDYEVKFELTGFATVTQKTAVPLGLTVEAERDDARGRRWPKPCRSSPRRRRRSPRRWSA